MFRETVKGKKGAKWLQWLYSRPGKMTFSGTTTYTDVIIKTHYATYSVGEHVNFPADKCTYKEQQKGDTKRQVFNKDRLHT